MAGAISESKFGNQLRRQTLQFCWESQSLEINNQAESGAVGLFKQIRIHGRSETVDDPQSQERNRKKPRIFVEFSVVTAIESRFFRKSLRTCSWRFGSRKALNFRSQMKSRSISDRKHQCKAVRFVEWLPSKGLESNLTPLNHRSNLIPMNHASAISINLLLGLLPLRRS